jgi:hypothetical protein
MFVKLILLCRRVNSDMSTYRQKLQSQIVTKSVLNFKESDKETDWTVAGKMCQQFYCAQCDNVSNPLQYTVCSHGLNIEGDITFTDIVPRGLVEVYRRFRVYCIDHHGDD